MALAAMVSGASAVSSSSGILSSFDVDIVTGVFGFE